MPDFSQIQQLPDISFVDTSVDDMLAAAINAYEQTYFNLTGQQVTVQPGDDVYILLYSNALQNYSILQSIDFAAKQNFLKYSSGDYLKHVGANTGNIESSSQPAVTSLTFTLGVIQAQPVVIPQGSRVTPGNNLYFSTDQAVTIPVGSTDVSVTATCVTPGSIGNGYIPGQINILVDSIPYIQSITNTQTSEGGSDQQDELSFKSQIFSANQGFSVAGPAGAYDYFARLFSSSVIDTAPISPSPGVVNLYILLSGGTIPNQTFLNELAAYLGADNRRPLTDNLTVLAPTVQNYIINFTYYIDQANANQAGTIQAAVQSAVNNYALWTQSKIGRGIIPDQLTTYVIGAGAKRVEITSPVFTSVVSSAIAVVQTVTINFGGIE
jgi:phage-related baseplate assembly protein